VAKIAKKQFEALWVGVEVGQNWLRFMADEEGVHFLKMA
jgi:hypothetical protein